MNERGGEERERVKKGRRKLWPFLWLLSLQSGTKRNQYEAGRSVRIDRCLLLRITWYETGRTVRVWLRTRRSQVRILQGAPLFSESFGKPRARASVLARRSTSETLSIRVADRVAGVFAWHTAWHHRDPDESVRPPQMGPVSVRFGRPPSIRTPSPGVLYRRLRSRQKALSTSPGAADPTEVAQGWHTIRT